MRFNLKKMGKTLIGFVSIILILLTISSASAMVYDLGANLEIKHLSNSGYHYRVGSSYNDYYQYIAVIQNTNASTWEIWTILIDPPNKVAYREVFNMSSHPIITVASDGSLVVGNGNGIFIKSNDVCQPYDWNYHKNAGDFDDTWSQITTESPNMLTASSEFVYYTYGSGQNPTLKKIDAIYNIQEAGTLNLHGFSSSYNKYWKQNGLIVADNYVCLAYNYGNSGSGFVGLEATDIRWWYLDNSTLLDSVNDESHPAHPSTYHKGFAFYTDLKYYVGGQRGDNYRGVNHTDLIPDTGNVSALDVTYDRLQMASMVDGDLIVYINAGDLESVQAEGEMTKFEEQYQDGGGDQPEWNVSSKYKTKLSRDTMYAGGTVKVYITDSDGNYLDGIPIYVDGNKTGKSTRYHSFFDWIPLLGGLIGEGKPYAEISVDESGSHYVNGEVGSVMSEGVKM